MTTTTIFPTILAATDNMGDFRDHPKG